MKMRDWINVEMNYKLYDSVIVVSSRSVLVRSVTNRAS